MIPEYSRVVGAARPSLLPAALSVLVAICATGSAPGAGLASSDAAGGVAVYGYPWAHSCPAAGIADVVDRWSMYACNCTSYVAWALVANDQRIDWFRPGAMDARNWPHVARLAGIAVGGRPRVGAVAVWPKASPPYGHLAYVIDVHADDTFEVAEYNLATRGEPSPYTFDIRDDLHPPGAVFIYVPARPPGSPARSRPPRR